MSPTASVKTRFCPSPTGQMHLGNVRTALFNVLLSQHHHGHFLLRIEDTDAARSEQRHIETLCEDLQWLGLHWQEGYQQGGSHAPYNQAARGQLYAQYYQQLIDQQQAYPCFCDDETLAADRQQQLAQGQPPRYSGRCRDLTAEEVARRHQSGEVSALRFRVPQHGSITVPDLVRGMQHYDCADLGDFIIRRSDGSSAFLFCNALDDALMQVTHALRGEDHLTNTPKQQLILQALGLSSPQYGHINLIVGSDGAPLSKRHGSESIASLRQQGYLATALLNYLARLGHHYADESWQTLAQLAQGFAVENLGQSPTQFDVAQLHYWQKCGLAQLDNAAFSQWAQPHLHALVPPEKHEACLALCRSCVLVAADVRHWSHCWFAEQLAWSDEALAVLQHSGAEFFAHAIQAFERCDEYQVALEQLKQLSGCRGKQLFMPLRYALSGEGHGPELPATVALMGRERVLARFEQAQQFLQ